MILAGIISILDNPRRIIVAEQALAEHACRISASIKPEQATRCWKSKPKRLRL